MWLNIIMAALILHYNTKVMTVFTRSCHCNLTWVKLIQSINSNPIPLRSILILSSYSCLVWFHTFQFFWPKSCVHFSFPMHAIFKPIPSPWIRFGEKKLWISSLCNFLQAPVTSTFSDSYILDLSPWINVTHFIWQNKFYTHTKQHLQIGFCILSFLCFQIAQRKK